MSYTKLFLLLVGLTLFNVAWWKAVVAVFLFVVVNMVESLVREKRLRKIINDEFDEGWATYELDSTIEVKAQVARLKLSDKDTAMLSRLARLMHRIALAYH